MTFAFFFQKVYFVLTCHADMQNYGSIEVNMHRNYFKKRVFIVTLIW